MIYTGREALRSRHGETYMAYLCGRPLRHRGRCTVGRETAIQKMIWGEDDWLRAVDGEGIPTLETPTPSLHEIAPASHEPMVLRVTDPRSGARLCEAQQFADEQSQLSPEVS